MHLLEGKEKGKRQKEIRLDKKSCKWGLSCWRAEERVGKTGKQCIRDTTEASLLLLHHHPLSVRFEDIIGYILSEKVGQFLTAQKCFFRYSFSILD